MASYPADARQIEFWDDTVRSTTNVSMRASHRRTLQRVILRPTPAGIRWGDIEALLRAVGVEVIERSGSRVLLRKDSDRMVVHRPHQRPETGRATVRDIAAFLAALGVEP